MSCVIPFTNLCEFLAELLSLYMVYMFWIWFICLDMVYMYFGYGLIIQPCIWFTCIGYGLIDTLSAYRAGHLPRVTTTGTRRLRDHRAEPWSFVPSFGCRTLSDYSARQPSRIGYRAETVFLIDCCLSLSCWKCLESELIVHQDHRQGRAGAHPVLS